MYKKSRYIGKGDTLNMKMVRLDAQLQYATRPKEMEYYINSYEECNKRGMNSSFQRKQC